MQLRESDGASCNILSFNFEQPAMTDFFFFLNEEKNFHRHGFMAINLLCKFGEDIFISE